MKRLKKRKQKRSTMKKKPTPKVMSKESSSPLDILAEKRSGGAESIKGFIFQCQYATWKILTHLKPSKTTEEKFIRLEGIEDIDAFKVATDEISGEFIQVKSSKNKMNAGKLKETNQKLEKYVNQIEEIAITDELTELYNRRYFNEVFPKEIQRAVRGRQAISFLMIDADYFKLYNDNYGHQKGDEALAAIGKVLKCSCKRASDIPVRLGGEEFGLIFSNSDAQQAAAFAEAIRNSVEYLKIEHAFNKATGHISVSCGLVTIINQTQKTDMDELYKIADKALYSAKKNGRNQVKQIIL